MPLGPNYLPSYAAGVREGLRELGPKLIGQDPTQIRVLNAFMDYNLKGHPYVKSPVDMACWDILGKVTEFFFFKLEGLFSFFFRSLSCRFALCWAGTIKKRFCFIEQSAKDHLKI